MEKIYKDSEERFVRNVKTYACFVDEDVPTMLSFTPELTKESAVTISQAREMFEAGQLLVYFEEDGAWRIAHPTVVEKGPDGSCTIDAGTEITVLSDDKHEWDLLVNPRPAG